MATDHLQPLDVNYNRQLKKFYDRIAEEALYRDVLSNLTSREGIINVHSLMHYQISAPAYQDMLRYAWRHTDSSFNITELANVPPKMVSDIQFYFNGREFCSVSGCKDHAFIRCSHRGKLMCLHHFLSRTCFHQTRSKREIESEDVDELRPERNESEPTTVTLQDTADFVTAAPTSIAPPASPPTQKPKIIDLEVMQDNIRAVVTAAQNVAAARLIEKIGGLHNASVGYY